MQIKSNQQRISVLQGIMKCCICLFLLFIIFQLFSSDDAFTKVESVDIVIQESQFSSKPEYMQLELVSHRPLLIIKYIEADKACLNVEENLESDWLVAWAQGGSSACPLTLLSSELVTSQSGKACRVLQDQCDKVLYDLQGMPVLRSSRTQPLKRPAYAIDRKKGKLILTVQVATL